MDEFPFPSVEAAWALLASDPLGSRIPAEDLPLVFEGAWERGSTAASQLLCGRSVREVLRRERVAVQSSDIDNVVAGRRCFSEYSSARRRITMYTVSVSAWANANGVEPAFAEGLTLAHEFYHVLEAGQLGETSGLYQVPTLRIGRWVALRSGVRALSEVGAYACARTYYDGLDP